MGNSQSNDDPRAPGSHGSHGQGQGHGSHGGRSNGGASASNIAGHHQNSSDGKTDSLGFGHPLTKSVSHQPSPAQQQHHYGHHHSSSQGNSPSSFNAKGVASRTSASPGKSSAVLPTTQILTAHHTAPASTSTSTEHAQATVTSASPHRAHSRPRSITLANPTKILPLEAAVAAGSHRSDNGIMGNEASKHARTSSRSATVDPATLNPRPTNTPPPHALAPEPPVAAPSPAAQPVDVPFSAARQEQLDAETDTAPVTVSSSPYGLPPANYSRPPRLPLPIEEEIYTPGSPIITPQEVSDSLNAQDDIIGGPLASRGSVLSSNADEDEDGDNDTFFAETSQSLQVRIPTKLEWNNPGEKVFVTGTFCDWDKKIKLHRNADGQGFSAVLPLPPGTHHLKFLVDGEMVTNPDMPTTVDWSNILVNYFEVAAPLTAEQQAEPTGAIPVLGATEPPPTNETATPAIDMPVEKPAAADSALKKTVLPTREAPSAAAPVPTDRETKPATTATTAATRAGEDAKKKKAAAAAAESRQLKGQPIPAARYTTTIPDFLLDLDRYNTPEDERFQRAQRVLGTLPHPPSLPMFLGKSILNAGTPQKDDASVLVIPNHTVINHLATSSIKGGVLAISSTTRYKRKVSGREFSVEWEIWRCICFADRPFLCST